MTKSPLLNCDRVKVMSYVRATQRATGRTLRFCVTDFQRIKPAF